MAKIERETLTHYQIMYRLINEGAYNDIFRDSETFAEVGRISVKKIKNDCKKRNVDFDDFLKYAQKRKAEENAET